MGTKLRKRVKVYCDHAKQEVEFDFFQLPHHKDAYGVMCDGPGKEKPCRRSKGCALYEKFWFDGSIANKQQQEILKKVHRKGEWDEKCVEWLDKHKKKHVEDLAS